jgi:class 3 adenylate cyclase/S1-C subfamily serine protease
MEQRRTVTTLFCDIVGFTKLSEGADPEDVDRLLGRYAAVARAAIEAHGGTVEKFIGDAVVAVFGVPTVHEDDAERAVRAGLRLIEDLEELTRPDGSPLEVRVGVNTGDALVRLDVDPASGRGFLTGDAVNTAARLQGVTPPMTVAVGEATHAATARVFRFDACHAVALKGKAEPVRAWIAVEPLARTGSELRSFTTSFFGREEELAQLSELLERAVAEHAVQTGLIVGEPGIGKSRLLAEFSRLVDERPDVVTWRQGRCLPFGSGITFWALSEIVRDCAGILETDGVARAEALLETVLPEGESRRDDRDRLRARLRPLLGLASDDASREENFGAWREFLEGLAARGPTVIVVEDIHWADEGMLAFLDFLAESTATVPLLVLATGRQEVLELSGGGAAFVAAAEQVALGALSGDETAQLVLARLGATSLSVKLQGTLLERSGGNPLFAEELVRLLQDRDLLVTRGGQMMLREGAEVPMPDSIGALIAARLDVLSPERKALLADASVVGRTFWAGAVAAIGEADQAQVYQGLMELVAKELVRPERTSSMEGETEFLFVHALVRDVAYGQLTRTDRAQKHAALARWLEERTAGRTEDLAEILAYHFGTALEMANACGLDDLEDELAEPTTRYLELAGGRAQPLDAAAAAAHFARAERVADEAAKPKRRWGLSRRTRRKLRRRAPLLVAAAAVIVVALVAAFAIWQLKPAPAAPAGPVKMTPAQIAKRYGSSVVRITTPVMPAAAAESMKPKRLGGSGFMATEDGIIVTSLANVQGVGVDPPMTVRVEFAKPTGEYGTVTGDVISHLEDTGIALVKVDPGKVPLAPLPLGDSESLAELDTVVSLAAQRDLAVQWASGPIAQLQTSTDQSSGNTVVTGFTDAVEYPVSAEPLSMVGGPLFDVSGQVVGLVGPAGVGTQPRRWDWEGGLPYKAVAISQAIRDIRLAGKFGGSSWEEHRAYMGVEYQWVPSAEARRAGAHEGAAVTAVYVGSPAAQAGIRSGRGVSDPAGDFVWWLGGDVIVAVDGTQLTGVDQLRDVLMSHKVGDVVALRLWRHDRLTTVRATMAALP